MRGQSSFYSHAQNNNIKKSDCGAIVVFSHEGLVACGPAIAEMLQGRPERDENDCYQFHHEDIDAFKEIFRNKKNKSHQNFC